MHAAFTWFPRLVLSGWTSRWGAWRPHRWLAFTPGDDECLLCEATDLADLERRLRRLERGRDERFGPLPRGL